MRNKAGLVNFGKLLKEKREQNRIGLREICRKVGFDSSNWSKIERGKISPPSDENVLAKWAKALGIKKSSEEYNDFIDYALIAQGIIPKALDEDSMLKLLPAFFRTVRNTKPTREELDELIKIIKEES